ncbi:hypothetical protein TNCT_22421 [Trichonephila clavata]|uniref:C2H2-type domain-containing protein n=1 Tax=Trichonephila clavata TaxID=2740835 RepID=A0A8X6H887_TRICU|nr:hypothetical protein TNCT_22421 [Trichonephila clavata]
MKGEFSGNICSTKNPMEFLTQILYDRHLAQCHPDQYQSGRSNDPASGGTSNPEAKWCPHCVRFLSPSSQMRDRRINSPDEDQKPSCDICGQKCKTRKGLTYHLLRNHGVSVGRKNLQRNTVKQETVVKPSHFSPLDVHSNVSSRDCNDSTSMRGVSLLGETMRLTFPLPHVLECPKARCQLSFRTVKWYTTNTSMKEHLTVVHRLANRRIEYWCSLCNRKIADKPATHPCLNNDLVVEYTTRQATCRAWNVASSSQLIPAYFITRRYISGRQSLIECRSFLHRRNQRAEKLRRGLNLRPSQLKTPGTCL